MERIETEIKEIFLSKAGKETIRFTAEKPSGGNWAISQIKFEKLAKSVGENIQPREGLSVRISTENGEVVGVRKGAGTPTFQEKGPQGKAPVAKMPYGFFPVDPEHSVTDTPVWHDGLSEEKLYSGEMRCTLTALTPLLPGNTHYKIGEINEEKRRDWGFKDVEGKKKIVEPLRLPDGKVVIAGSALKGMIRHSLGALLSAPMERVAEHHYTYRPNLDFSKNPDKYTVKPALVTAANKDGGWVLDVFNKEVIFVRQDAVDVIRKNARNGIIIAGTVIKGVIKEGRQKDSSHISKQSSGETRFSIPYQLVSYRGGIDGEGLLAKAFGQSSFTYEIALVPEQSDYKASISKKLYERYLHDQDILADNTHGHLTAHPLGSKLDDVPRLQKAIKGNSGLKVKQLIYVEWEVDTHRVVSFGHHFRYRWAYNASVRRTHEEKLRECLTPNPCEQVKESEVTDSAPEKLTGARLLFGYVRSDENPIGKGVFERMAGRIAINHAISQGIPEFLGEEKKGYCVPLKILGSPKPSAWEFYLQQDTRKPVATYGDIPEDAGGELAGRKFYGHQIADDANDANAEKISIERIRAADESARTSEQAAIARFICKAGTQFRFTIRFSDLREWELGALLAVLEPKRLAGNAGEYGHKLGLGRPIGMGSVQIKVDHIELEVCTENFTQTLRKKLQEAKISELSIKRWLELHELVKRTLDYPMEDGAIFTWHTNRHKEYSALRREKTRSWGKLHNEIRKVKL